MAGPVGRPVPKVPSSRWPSYRASGPTGSSGSRRAAGLSRY